MANKRHLNARFIKNSPHFNGFYAVLLFESAFRQCKIRFFTFRRDRPALSRLNQAPQNRRLYI